MSRLSIFFQILKKVVVKPQLLQELAEERAEVKDDAKFKTHNYSYDFNSIENFFKDKFPDVNIKDFEKELEELDEHMDNFFLHDEQINFF